MVRSLAPSIAFMTVVATLGIAGAVARGADNDRSGDFAAAASGGACAGLPSHDALRAALVDARGQANGGFNLDMWGAVVNRDGIVCAVAFTGTDRGRQWPGSRAIAAQKANTANAFSLPGPGALDRESLGRRCSPAVRCMACSTAIRSARALRTRDRQPHSARMTIRWSASASAA
jgi:hypothetical protein